MEGTISEKVRPTPGGAAERRTERVRDNQQGQRMDAPPSRHNTDYWFTSHKTRRRKCRERCLTYQGAKTGVCHLKSSIKDPFNT